MFRFSRRQSKVALAVGIPLNIPSQRSLLAELKSAVMIMKLKRGMARREAENLTIHSKPLNYG